MSKTKVNKSLTFDPDILKQGIKQAYIIDRTFSWYVNDLVKKDLKANKMIE